MAGQLGQRPERPAPAARSWGDAQWSSGRSQDWRELGLGLGPPRGCRAWQVGQEDSAGLFWGVCAGVHSVQ